MKRVALLCLGLALGAANAAEARRLGHVHHREEIREQVSARRKASAVYVSGTAIAGLQIRSAPGFQLGAVRINRRRIPDDSVPENPPGLAHQPGGASDDARQRMRERFSVSELAQTTLGGRVVCEERDLLYEEAPAAYKNIEAVIADLVAAGLVSVIAVLRPLLTYKTRKERR